MFLKLHFKRISFFLLLSIALNCYFIAIRSSCRKEEKNIGVEMDVVTPKWPVVHFEVNAYIYQENFYVVASGYEQREHISFVEVISPCYRIDKTIISSFKGVDTMICGSHLLRECISVERWRPLDEMSAEERKKILSGKIYLELYRNTVPRITAGEWGGEHVREELKVFQGEVAVVKLEDKKSCEICKIYGRKHPSI